MQEKGQQVSVSGGGEASQISPALTQSLAVSIGGPAPSSEPSAVLSEQTASPEEPSITLTPQPNQQVVPFVSA